MFEQEKIKPYGAEGSKRNQVEAMFNNIAPTYDLLNHTLSFGVDRMWRNKAIRHIRQHTCNTILDVATGTGDFAILAAQRLPQARITGIDISQEMMNVGKEKVRQAHLEDRIDFRYEDCANLSFPENTFDAVISSFALRNFENLYECLTEMHRVLRPTGVISVVDLCTPVSFPMKQLFHIYSRWFMPAVGKLISHDNSAYTYLPETMAAVPQGQTMADIFTQAGFTQVKYKRLLFGMCMLYTATK